MNEPTKDELVKKTAAARSELHDVLGQLARVKDERDESRRTQVRLVFGGRGPCGQPLAQVGGDGMDGERVRYVAWCPYDVAHIWWGETAAKHLYGTRPTRTRRPQRIP